MEAAAAHPANAVHRFGPSRPRAWARVVMGWICAQSFLTLLPIAPPGWGAAFLIVTGGGFAVWALTGLRLALTRRAVLELGGAGLRIGLDARPIRWEGVTGWRAEPEARCVALCLVGGGRRRIALASLDASLTDVARAFRDVRPDLELPP